MPELWTSQLSSPGAEPTHGDNRFWEPPKSPCNVAVRFYTFDHVITSKDVELGRAKPADIGQKTEQFYCPFLVCSSGKRSVYGMNHSHIPKERLLERYALLVDVEGIEGLKIWEAGKTVARRLLAMTKSPDYLGTECFGSKGIDFFVMVTEGAAIERLNLIPRLMSRDLLDQQTLDLWSMPEFFPTDSPPPTAQKSEQASQGSHAGSPPPLAGGDTMRHGTRVRINTPSGAMAAQVSDGPDDEGLYTVIAEDSSIWTVKRDEVAPL